MMPYAFLLLKKKKYIYRIFPAAVDALDGYRSLFFILLIADFS